MPQKSAEIVRQPVAVGARSRRRLEERLALRFRLHASLLIRMGLRWLPPRSRLRRWGLRRLFRQAIEALNRGDFEAAFCFFDRDCEFVPFQIDTLGLEGTRGRNERIRFQQRWVEAWGEFRFEPEEIIDLGDDRRLMWVGHTRGSGLRSGVPITSECAVLLTISDGWVIRDEVYFDHAQALKAAGLGE